MRKFLAFAILLLLVTASSAQTIQLVLGNPSNAVTDQSQPDNFLLEHSGYVVSYNRSRGTPNWVTWHLQASDIGSIDRTNAFRADESLPSAWRIKKADYNNSGFDRGHMCPSEERSDTEENNRETFLMSNMQPQLHKLNGGTWKSLEGYLQTQAKQGFEAYITAGCYGNSGRLKDKVTVPTHCWKIAVILTKGNNDRSRIKAQTRVIAVNMPNTPTIVSGWRNYRTTVDAIESATGLNFFKTLPSAIESAIEAKIDDQ